jgi:hypothetical protein
MSNEIKRLILTEDDFQKIRVAFKENCKTLEGGYYYADSHYSWNLIVAQIRDFINTLDGDVRKQHAYIAGYIVYLIVEEDDLNSNKLINGDYWYEDICCIYGSIVSILEYLVEKEIKDEIDGKVKKYTLNFDVNEKVIEKCVFTFFERLKKRLRDERRRLALMSFTGKILEEIKNDNSNTSDR